MPKGNKNHGRSKEEIERKRDERARRNALKKEREAKEYLENDENFVSFSNQLQALGYKIKDIKGDGNCLFRALADQLEGDDSGHLRHRRIIAKYLTDHREEFEPFVEDNKSFDEHVRDLSRPGTYGGNDSIVAFSRIHGVNIIIHQLNEQCWVIQGRQYASVKHGMSDLHISYHNGDHYSSVRRIGDPDDGPAWMFNNKTTKVKDKSFQGITDYGDHPKKKSLRKKDPEVYCSRAEALPLETSDITFVKAATGCEDSQLIEEILGDSNNDLDAAISYILQLQSVMDMKELGEGEISHTEPTSDEAEGTRNAIHGDQSNVEQKSKVLSASSVSKKSHAMTKGARPKAKQQSQHLSNSKRKQLAKQDKKTRRMEEQRKEAQRRNDPQNLENPQDNQPLPLVGDIEALAI